MWTILHCWQISISAGAKYCLSHRANLTFCWFLDEQFRHGLKCFSLVLLRTLSQYPSTFLQNKKNSTSGSTWRVKAVIIEATSPPWAVSNAAWPAGFFRMAVWNNRENFQLQSITSSPPPPPSIPYHSKIQSSWPWRWWWGWLCKVFTLLVCFEYAFSEPIRKGVQFSTEAPSRS